MGNSRSESLHQQPFSYNSATTDGNLFMEPQSSGALQPVSITNHVATFANSSLFPEQYDASLPCTSGISTSRRSYQSRQQSFSLFEDDSSNDSHISATTRTSNYSSSGSSSSIASTSREVHRQREVLYHNFALKIRESKDVHKFCTLYSQIFAKFSLLGWLMEAYIIFLLLTRCRFKNYKRIEITSNLT